MRPEIHSTVQRISLVLGFLLFFVLLVPINIYAAASSSHYITEIDVPTAQSGPLAVTIDSKGDVWFTESNASKIAKYNPASNQFEEFQLPYGLGDMWGIIATHDGEIWFTQYGASSASTYATGGFLPGGRGTLWNFDPLNNSFRSYALNEPGTMPFRLAEDRHGWIWFTQLLGNSLGVFDPKTQRFSQFSIPTENSGPADLCIDASGRIWFTESTARAIGVYDPSNSSFREFRFDSILAPVGISIDSGGLVWVADHGLNRIGRFNPATGQLITFPTSNPTNGIFPYSLPNDLSIDSHGDVWFTEHVANRIGKIDPINHLLTEYQIPTGPISTALWLAIMPDGNVCFTEYSYNKIGILDPIEQIPFTVTIDHESVQVRQGSTSPVELTAKGQAGNLQLFVASTLITPNSLNASFSSNPISIGSLANPSPVIIVDIDASQSATPGQYVMVIGGSSNQVSVSVLLPVIVIGQPLPDVAFPLVLAGLGVVFLLVFMQKRRSQDRRRSDSGLRRRKRRKSSHVTNPITCFCNFTEKHKIGLLILGVAATNIFGAAGGGLHLLILEAPTRIIPYPNATLSTYGFFAFWLDVLELLAGLLTVYFVLLAWKPRKRVAVSIMLGIILIASSLFIITSIPGAKPMNCDIVIKNSLFYGGYYPATLTIPLTNNGATVTWCVDSNSIHSDTVTSDTGIFNSGTIPQGGSWSYTFIQSGQYHYHSLLHFWMHGTIVVVRGTQSIPENTQTSPYESGATILQTSQESTISARKLPYLFST
jgi:virginiamycin B lyase